MSTSFGDYIAAKVIALLACVGLALPTSDLDVVVLNLPVLSIRNNGAVKQLSQIKMGIIRMQVGDIIEVCGLAEWVRNGLPCLSIPLETHPSRSVTCDVCLRLNRSALPQD